MWKMLTKLTQQPQVKMMLESERTWIHFSITLTITSRCLTIIDLVQGRAHWGQQASKTMDRFGRTLNVDSWEN